MKILEVYSFYFFCYHVILALEASYAVLQHLSLFFLFFHENICCGYSLEGPQWGTSYEYPGVVWWGKGVVCLLLQGVKLILAYSWARPAILAAGIGRGRMFFFSSVSVTSFTSFSPVPLFTSTISSISPHFIWEMTQNDPQGLTCC